MIEIYPEFLLFIKIYDEYIRKSKNGVDFTTINIDNNSAHYLYSTSFDNIYLSINYNPAANKEMYANITFEYRILSNQKTGNILIKYEDTQEIICIYEGNKVILSEEKIMKFLEDLILNYIKPYLN